MVGKDLNLALQNVSLGRQVMDESSEKAVKNANSMQAIHDAISSNSELESQVNKSLDPVLELLNKRFERMKLKDCNFRAAAVATKCEMEDMFEEVNIHIDGSVRKDCLQQKELQKATDLQQFLKTHSHISQYAFQVRKCTDTSCIYCSSHPLRMPLDVFTTLGFLPLPIIDSSAEHFQPFKDVYGQVPIEKDRPSLRCTNDDNDATEFDKVNHQLLTSAKVRAALTCTECFKPQCVYSAARITELKNPC